MKKVKNPVIEYMEALISFRNGGSLKTPKDWEYRRFTFFFANFY